MAKKPITTDLIVQNQVQVPDLSLVASKLKRVSDETRNTYKYAMNSFKNYCTKNKVSADLDSLLQWLESVQSPSTQSTHIAAVKKVFGEIYKHDPRLIELKEELENIRPVKRDMKITSSKYLKKDEVYKIIELSPKPIGIMIETLFITGLRITELLNLRHDKAVMVNDKKKTYYELKIIGKRKKENTVLISEKLYKKINKCFNGKVFLFEHENKQYSREHITREIAKAGLLIGKDISAHGLRHSRAMDLAERGISLDKISKFLNHANINVTAGFYLHNKPSIEELNIFEK